MLKEYLEEDALEYIRGALDGDAEDLAQLKKIAKIFEEGKGKIGRKLSKAEAEAGMEAFWGEGGEAGALAAIEQYFKWGDKYISAADRLKINEWKYTPSDELYLKYKDVYDNPKYYNQSTGEIHWPKNNGFANNPVEEILKPGTRIDMEMILVSLLLQKVHLMK